jgi:hypothetical protein
MPVILTYGLGLEGGSPPTPPTPPVVSNVSPAPGTPITILTPIEFDVTDDVGLKAVLISASFSGISGTELAFDGTAFTAMYSSDSSRTAITDGYHFQILRTNGWPGPPTITPYAFDTKGNEN